MALQWWFFLQIASISFLNLRSFRKTGPIGNKWMNSPPFTIPHQFLGHLADNFKSGLRLFLPCTWGGYASGRQENCIRMAIPELTHAQKEIRVWISPILFYLNLLLPGDTASGRFLFSELNFRRNTLPTRVACARMPVPGFPGAPMEIKGSISRRYHIILSSPFQIL
jgi:hypothetical protein